MSLSKFNNKTISTLSKINRNNFYPLDSYTKLLLKFNGSDGATTYTAETGQTVTFVGTAQLDTAQKKFGASSLLLDGDSDYVTVPDSEDWNFGTGDFTIDFCVKFNSFTLTYYPLANFFRQYVGTVTQTMFGFHTDTNTLEFSSATGSPQTFQAKYTASWTPSLNTWYHLAVVRNGTSIYIFVNGVSLTLTVVNAIGTNSLANSTAVIQIGTYNDGGGRNYLNGCFDEFRISKGIARWTSNFTPPVDIAKINGITV